MHYLGGASYDALPEEVKDKPRSYIVLRGVPGPVTLELLPEAPADYKVLVWDAYIESADDPAISVD